VSQHFDAVIVAHTLTYGLFALAIMWAALWLGGPLLRAGLRPLLLAAVVLPLVLYSDLTLQYIAGYPSQTLGLVELVILVAVLARPVGRGRTQLVLATALTVAVGYTYYLYLPAALLCGGIWAYARRRDLRRVHLWFLVPIALALVPLGRGLLAGQADRLQFTGSPPMVGRDLVLALFILVLAGLATRSGRRSPIWRGYLRSTVVVGSSVVAIGLFQLGTAGATGYYFDKMLGAAEVVVLAGLGVVTLLLPAPVRHPRDLRTRVRANTPTALATVALLVLGAGALHDSSYRSGVPGELGHRVAQRLVPQRGLSAVGAGHPRDTRDSPRPGGVGPDRGPVPELRGATVDQRSPGEDRRRPEQGSVQRVPAGRRRGPV
jgi:hypothetical protein